MVTHGKDKNFMVFNNLAFFTPFGFFLDMIWLFFSKDVWQPWTAGSFVDGPYHVF